MMKLAILTNQTTHHAFFIKKLIEHYHVDLVLLEEKKNKPSFETVHDYEKKMVEYENQVFFDHKNTQIKELVNSKSVLTVNDDDSKKLLHDLKPDVIVVFGTGKISCDVIQISRNRIINLHGGDPENYRGLDTHLWAIYHREFSELTTTLHHLNEELDDGAIISQANIPLKPNMNLHELRAENTHLCIDLVLNALDFFKRKGQFLSRPQKKIGRYYSFMPSVLKEICVKRFKQYTRSFE